MQTHKTRMIDRRERQLAREPGFTPVRNQRIDKAIQAATLMLQLPPHKMSAPTAQAEATRMVAKGLPARRMVRSYAAKPSKSDSPKYRKPFVRALRPA